MKNYGNLRGVSGQVSRSVVYVSGSMDGHSFILAIIGLQGFFPLKGQAAVGVGSIEYPATERKRLAAL